MPLFVKDRTRALAKVSLGEGSLLTAYGDEQERIKLVLIFLVYGSGRHVKAGGLKANA